MHFRSRAWPASLALVLPALAAVATAQQDWRRVPGLVGVSGGAAAQDPLNGRLVRFGGLRYQLPTLPPYVADDTTWLWDGQAWTEVTGLAQRPPARFSSLMTYDYVRQRTVLFGGETSAAPLTDTWEWDGVQWTQIATATTPPALAYAALAFDGSRTILFGGQVNGVVSDETWAFDGVDWTLLQPATRPSPRSSHMMASGPGEVLLFAGATGGQPGNYPPNETWRWDGNDWQQLPTTAAPVTRTAGALGYDPVLARYLLFGGYAPLFVPETWQFQSGDWTEIPTARNPRGLLGRSAAFHFPSNRWVGWFSVGSPNPTNSSVTYEFGSNLGWAEGFGQGCSATPGPLRLNHVAGQPRLGDVFELELEPVVGLPIVSYGWSDQTAPFGPLPFPLANIGAVAPNCALYHSADVLELLPPGPTASIAVTVPNNPQLVGFEFFVQGFDLAGPSLALLRATRALACGVGSL